MMFFRGNEAKQPVDSPIENDNGPVLKELEKISGFYKQSQFSFRRLLREIYIKEMNHYNQTGKRKIPCVAGFASIHIDPYGNVYGCSQLKIAVGNIRKNTIQEILNSAHMKNWRDTYSYKCERCLSGCAGVTSIVQDMPNSLLKHQFTT